MTGPETPQMGGTVESERSSYLAEIHRLRTLIILAADELALVENELVPWCQHVTDDNAWVRMSLLAVRNLRAILEKSGRPGHRTNGLRGQAMSEADRFLCLRCGHSPTWHRLDDSLNVSPVDPAAEFRCLGVDFDDCPIACPDFVPPLGYAEWIETGALPQLGRGGGS